MPLPLPLPLPLFLLQMLKYWRMTKKVNVALECESLDVVLLLLILLENLFGLEAILEAVTVDVDEVVLVL